MQYTSESTGGPDSGGPYTSNKRTVKFASESYKYIMIAFSLVAGLLVTMTNTIVQLVLYIQSQ